MTKRKSRGASPDPKKVKSDSKNKTKCFWEVQMNSFRFESMPPGYTKISELLELTRSKGESFLHYCCLGLFVDKTPNQQESYIVKRRFKHSIATSGAVKEVTMFEIFGTTIETHSCKKVAKGNYYSTIEDLCTNNNESRLAWAILYEDKSFDVHVTQMVFKQTVSSILPNFVEFDDVFEGTLTSHKGLKKSNTRPKCYIPPTTAVEPTPQSQISSTTPSVVFPQREITVEEAMIALAKCSKEVRWNMANILFNSVWNEDAVYAFQQCFPPNVQLPYPDHESLVNEECDLDSIL